MNIPVLETERLRLREPRQADYEAYAAMMADAETVRYLRGVPLTRDIAWRDWATLAGHWMLRGYGYWAVERKDTGAFIGRCGLWNPEGWPGMEVGWTIERSLWGRGYAGEAGRAAMDYALNNFDIDELLSVIHVDNAASMAVAQKLGERRLREMEILGLPVAIFGISRAELVKRQA